MSGLLKISEATSLALHTTVLLAGCKDQPLSTPAIAKQLKVSQAHLAKVLQRLTRSGIVVPLRGRVGGFKLAKHPDQITLLNVYQAIEGNLPSKICLLSSPVCGSSGCILGGLLYRLTHEVAEYLTRTRLSDFTRPN